MPSGWVKRGEPCTRSVVCVPVCRSTMMAVEGVEGSEDPERNSAWLPSPDQSTNSGCAFLPGGGNVVIA